MGFSRFVPQMWERLRRFRRWPGAARLMFFRAAVLLPLISLSLRIRGFGATQKWQRWPAPPETSANKENKASKIATVERAVRSEEHTSELQSHVNLVCRLLLEKKKKQ